ncbi:hypothetical protein CC80DRAFT_508442 [Byssothecium circinans]|uniref:Uncharacterized protein n=1 Tax=Byssothecium circinans TaxID=147558 RepID=A0A6A5TMR9_9PLEO|nr:hypothetical protein CC80DRAFT_508442 [Byssothecium circinans]
MEWISPPIPIDYPYLRPRFRLATLTLDLFRHRLGIIHRVLLVRLFIVELARVIAPKVLIRKARRSFLLILAQTYIKVKERTPIYKGLSKGGPHIRRYKRSTFALAKIRFY